MDTQKFTRFSTNVNNPLVTWLMIVSSTRKAKHPYETTGKVASTMVLRLALPMLTSRGAL